MVVAIDIEAFLKELVGEDSRLPKSINAATNFEIDQPPWTRLVRSYSKMNSSWMLERGTQIYSGQSSGVQR